MKKLALALLLVIGVSGANVFACGGMTQIDPPSLQLQAGPTDGPPESILDSIEDFMVIC